MNWDLFGPVAETEGRKHYCVPTLEALEALATHLEGAEVLALDWETTTAALWDPTFDILGIALARWTGESFYVPFGHKLPEQAGLFEDPVPQVPFEEARPILERIFSGPLLVAHNFKFDAAVCESVGLDIWDHPLFDTYIAAALTNDTQERGLGLKALTESWLGRSATKIQELDDNANLIHTALELVVAYAGDDACNALGLYEFCRPKLERAPRVKDLFWKLEMPVVQVTAAMEQRGILVKTEVIHDIHTRAKIVQDETHRELQHMAGFPFEPNKSDHVKQLLYDQYMLPEARRAGQDTTDTKQMQLLFTTMDKDLQEKARPAFDTYIVNRTAAKILSTYTTKLLGRTYGGRVHPGFLQANTFTGRYSSRNPNFQNMPRDDEHFDVRSAFIPDPGYVFVVADFMQMEFKIAAALSRDPILVVAANDLDIDIHSNTARAIFGLKPDQEVAKEQRQAAKTITFAVLYGATAVGISRQIMMSEKKAAELINKFYQTYAGLKQWIDDTHRFIMQKGYAETYWGRRRYADPKKIRTNVDELRSGELRKLTNMVVQGTGADFTKLAMKRVWKQFNTRGMRAKIVGQIHDELIILCPKAEGLAVGEILEQHMASVMWPDTKHQVALPIDMEFKSSLSKSKTALLEL
jgi:DNA polymerase-1